MVKSSFMILFLFVITLLLMFCGQGRPQYSFRIRRETEEDRALLKESLTLLGPPQDNKKFNLPGPRLSEFTVGETKNEQSNDGSGNYTFLFRIPGEYFSYNARYEVGELKRVGIKETQVVKGQYSEVFKRKSGGYYIRTIGYVADENGYRPFLIDLSTATKKYRLVPALSFLVGPGGPSIPKIAISSTVLASLVGGNTLG